jgi:aryl-alcohol dehydrogenase-like predicted oxidoreductase
LLRKYDKTLPPFALRWTLTRPAVGAALAGLREPAELRETLGAIGGAISARGYGRDRCYLRRQQLPDSGHRAGS